MRGVFWTNLVQMGQNSVGRWRAGARLQVPLGPLLMLGICSLTVHLLMYGSETMLWKEKEKSRIRVVQMDNLRGFLVIRRIDRIPNAWIKELCGVQKGWMKGLMKACTGG